MFSTGLKKIKKAIDIADFKFLKFALSNCPLHGKSLFVRLDNTMLGVRCVLCGAAPIATSIADVLIRQEPDFRKKKIYELSARGAFFEFLAKNVKQLSFSEYMDNVKPGEMKDGVMCQDVQNLTFNDAEFDICTSTEVFEHVPDDSRGFAEIYRALRDGGKFIFTVPLHDQEKTVTRCVLKNGEITHLLKPEYHDDSLRGVSKVLVFRDYGHDIKDKLINAGFSQVDIFKEFDSAGFGYSKEVIVAHKKSNASPAALE